ncbi:site-specific recombinase, DNA invertase Pin (plasmid) [Actinoalloteichus sp. GBA129-24]|nr:site-specific recombinase, DNA invertase Pin [Actinoalloteichus sp. GBA129-24]
MGVRVVGVYLDNDISATTGSRKRTEYYEMLEILKRDSARVVLSWHSDRMHRNNRELEDYIDICEPRGILTHTVRAGTMDLSTAVGQAAARTFTAWAGAQARQTGERLALRQAANRREGRWAGGIRPFGWELDGESLRAAEAAEIRWATQAVVEGDSLRVIARQMNARGSRGTRGKEWIASTVKQILMRPRNCGLMSHEGQIVGRGRWAPAVSEEEWRACVDVLERRGARSVERGGRPPRWLGAMLYICGGCGQPTLRGMPVAGGKGQAKYACAPKVDRLPGVRHVTRQAAALDAWVQEALIERLSRPDAVKLLRRPDHARAEIDVAALHAELARLHGVLEALAEDYADGALTRSAMLLGTERARHRITVVGDELAAASEADPLAAIVGTDVRREWFGTEDGGMPGYSLERRRAILRRLVDVWVMPASPGRRAPSKEWWKDIDLRWKD